MRVLLIEDDSNDTFLIKSALSNFQCEIYYASSLKEGLDQKNLFDPDVILLDVNLPDASKASLSNSITNLKGSSAIIVISNYVDEKLVPECLAAGADDYIDKKLITEDTQRFLLRISRAWNTFKNRLEIPLKSGDVESSLASGQKQAMAKTSRIMFDKDRNGSLAVEQNFQILTQLDTIEKKVDHTNGTVKEHTKELLDIKYRHEKEDKIALAEKLEADIKAENDRKQKDRLITAVWSAAGTIGSLVVALVVNWISHVMGWIH